MLATLLLHGATIATTQVLWYRDALHLLLDESLQVAELSQFPAVVAVHHSERLAISVSTGRTSDAMHVVLRIVRHVEVDDKFDACDVNASADNVGSHQDIDTACFESIHRILSVFLLQIGVHRSHRKAFLAQAEHHIFYIYLLRDEDHHTLAGVLQNLILHETVV